MYKIYQTDGFILGSSPSGEADKYFYIFTRELGFITATARSVRSDKSKLRPLLQDFSLVALALVRGRDIWRITGVSTIIWPLSLTGESRALWARISNLLRRLLQGEGRNDALFEILGQSFQFLGTKRETSELADLEVLSVLRILKVLGYMAADASIGRFLKDADITGPLLEEMQKFRQIALFRINQSLRETHL